MIVRMEDASLAECVATVGDFSQVPILRAAKASLILVKAMSSTATCHTPFCILPIPTAAVRLCEACIEDAFLALEPNACKMPVQRLQTPADQCAYHPEVPPGRNDFHCCQLDQLDAPSNRDTPGCTRKPIRRRLLIPRRCAQ